MQTALDSHRSKSTFTFMPASCSCRGATGSSGDPHLAGGGVVPTAGPGATSTAPTGGAEGTTSGAAASALPAMASASARLRAAVAAATCTDMVTPRIGWPDVGSARPVYPSDRVPWCVSRSAQVGPNGLGAAQHRAHGVEDFGVLDGARNRLVGAVGDAAHGLAQDLPRAGLGQRRHDRNVLERRHRPDPAPDELHQLGAELVLVAGDPRLQHDEP